MPFRTHLLVVANRTVDSPDLVAALLERAERGPVHVTLLVPVAWSERDDASRRIETAIATLREAGIEGQSILGDADPMVAVQEAWDPSRFDEVVVSTFPTGASRWIGIDLPHRVARLTDCTVRHVESRPPAQVAEEHGRAPEHPPFLESALSLMRTATRGRVA